MPALFWQVIDVVVGIVLQKFHALHEKKPTYLCGFFLAVNPLVYLTEVCELIKRGVAMNGEASVGTCLLETVLKSRKLRVAVIAVQALSWSAITMAQGNLNFHGTLVHAACQVMPTSISRTGDDSARYVQVSGITVRIDTAHNACGDKTVPVGLDYQALSSSQSLAVQNRSTSQTGVLTVTYQ